MKYIKSLLWVALLLPVAVQAQKDTTVYNESVVVTGEYTPVLHARWKKLNVAPRITDTNMQLEHDFQYSIAPKRLTSIFQPTRIKAAKIIGEPTSRLYNNYFRIGLGNYWSGLLDGFYQSTRSAKLTYGAYLHHYSGWGKIGKRTNDNPALDTTYWGRENFAQTELGAFVRYMWHENVELSSRLGYENDYMLYYGFTDSTLAAHGLRRDDISHGDYAGMYNVVRWRGGAKSLNTDVNRLGYETHVDVEHLWGRPGMSELHTQVDGTVHYGFPLFAQYKGVVALQLLWDHYGQRFGTTSAVDMPMGYTWAPQQGAPYADTVRQGKNVLSVHPYVDFLFKDFKFHVGGSLGVDDMSPDQTASAQEGKFESTGELYWFPDVTVSKNFLSDAMSVSAGFVGGSHCYSWDEQRQINPYIAPNQLSFAMRHYDVFARMRFDFSRKISVDMAVEYARFRNEVAFFVHPASVYGNMYLTRPVEFDRLKVGGNLYFVNDELLQASVGGNYYSYTAIENANNRAYLYNRPTFDVHLTAVANYKNKLRLQLQGLVLSGMDCDAGSGSSATGRLPLRYGVSARAEYLHTRAISFFLNVDNLAFQRYWYWYNYPSRRLSLLLGMTYTIPTAKK